MEDSIFVPQETSFSVSLYCLPLFLLHGIIVNSLIVPGRGGEAGRNQSSVSLKVQKKNNPKQIALWVSMGLMSFACSLIFF